MLRWLKLSNGRLVNLDKVQQIVPPRERRIQFQGPMTEPEMALPYILFDNNTELKISVFEYEEIVRRFKGIVFRPFLPDGAS